MKGNLQITNGTLKSNIGQYIKSLPDGSYFWQITKPKRTRSLAENKYYWGIVIKILSDYTGFDPDEMHEVIKYKFLAEKQRIAADRRKKLILPK